jgi:hypothetical protein
MFMLKTVLTESIVLLSCSSYNKSSNTNTDTCLVLEPSGEIILLIDETNSAIDDGRKEYSVLVGWLNYDGSILFNDSEDISNYYYQMPDCNSISILTSSFPNAMKRDSFFTNNDHYESEKSSFYELENEFYLLFPPNYSFLCNFNEFCISKSD